MWYSNFSTRDTEEVQNGDPHYTGSEGYHAGIDLHRIPVHGSSGNFAALHGQQDRGSAVKALPQAHP